MDACGETFPCGTPKYSFSSPSFNSASIFKTAQLGYIGNRHYPLNTTDSGCLHCMCRATSKALSQTTYIPRSSRERNHKNYTTTYGYSFHHGTPKQRWYTSTFPAGIASTRPSAAASLVISMPLCRNYVDQ